MKKWVVSKHDSLDLTKRIEAQLGIELDLSHSSQAHCEEPKEGIVFVHLDGLLFVERAGAFIPFLGSQETLSLFPSATVDEGAIKYLLNGADVMRPGITSHEDWGEVGKAVVVKEGRKGRAIAIGQSTVRSEEMAQISKGVCLKNLHHVGDEYWSLYKTV